MDKCVLVTGGSRGIGEAIAREFASKDYDVIINFKNSVDRAEKLKEELEAEYGVSVMLAQADITDEVSVENMIDDIIMEFGKLDVLINNAGIVIDREFDERTVQDWKETLNVNLIAPFLLTKLVGSEMLKQGHGSIVNISSTNGINTYYPTSVDYDASKAGIISLTYDSAVQFAPNIRVNCVAPGWVNTEMNDELPDDFVKSETERILVKRFAEPEEIAKAVYFLASEDASFINGTVLKVDGGWY